jgi:hypothetical protein
MANRVSLRLILYGHMTQEYEAVRRSFSYPGAPVNHIRDLAVTGLQLPAFVTGGHAPGKYSSVCFFQTGIGDESMVFGHGGVSSLRKRFFLQVGNGNEWPLLT